MAKRARCSAPTQRPMPGRWSRQRSAASRPWNSPSRYGASLGCGAAAAAAAVAAGCGRRATIPVATMADATAYCAIRFVHIVPSGTDDRGSPGKPRAAAPALPDPARGRTP